MTFFGYACGPEVAHSQDHHEKSAALLFRLLPSVRHSPKTESYPHFIVHLWNDHALF